LNGLLFFVDNTLFCFCNNFSSLVKNVQENNTKSDNNKTTVHYDQLHCQITLKYFTKMCSLMHIQQLSKEGPEQQILYSGQNAQILNLGDLGTWSSRDFSIAKCENEKLNNHSSIQERRQTVLLYVQYHNT